MTRRAESKSVGRPPLPRTRARRNRIAVYLTDAEARQIDREARAREATSSDIVREAVQEWIERRLA